jgi:hypothetical protein
MANPNFFIQISNSWMKWLLKSPLHGLVSGSTLLVTVTGRKTGKQITTPVNYIRLEDGLCTLSSRDRTWWRNLRGDSGCVIWLRGKETPAKGEVFEDPTEVAAALRKYIQAAPFMAKYLQVRRDAASGILNADDLLQAAATRVVIRFVPAEEVA